MKKYLFVAFAVLVLAATAFAAERRGPRMMGMHERVARVLDLTEEQRAAAKEIFEEQSAKAEPLMEQRERQWEELHALLDTANPNPAEVGNRVIAAHALRARIRALHEEGMARFKALLTEEQRAELEEMHERNEGHGPRFEMRGFGHGPGRH